MEKLSYGGRVYVLNKRETFPIFSLASDPPNGPLHRHRRRDGRWWELMN